jgi:hypothetical protein
MSLPGFTAEAGIGPTTQIYRVQDHYGTAIASGLYQQWNGGSTDVNWEEGLGEAAMEMTEEEGLGEAAMEMTEEEGLGEAAMEMTEEEGLEAGDDLEVNVDV